MSRRLRAYLPGVAFHLTARTQGHVPWVNPELRPAITELIRAGIRRADARLLAYAVMPTHFHLVVVQGNDPLARIMQGTLRRIALLVHRTHGTEGHVFERRFRESACTEPIYVRNAIVYTHLNPVRAALVNDPLDYAWSSHRAYCATGHRGERETPDTLDVQAGLDIFAAHPERSTDELRSDYLRFVDWRIAMDRFQAAAESGAATGPPPHPPAISTLSAAQPGCRNGALDVAGPPRTDRASDARDARAANPHAIVRRPDLRDLTLRLIGTVRPGLDLEWIRGRSGSPERVRIRRAVIRQAARLGYRGVDIARFLAVSEATVSRVLSGSHGRPASRS